MIPLYKVPKNTRIDVRHLELENRETKERINELLFHHIDGMYSLCTSYKHGTIHLPANTMVNVLV